MSVLTDSSLSIQQGQGQLLVRLVSKFKNKTKQFLRTGDVAQWKTACVAHSRYHVDKYGNTQWSSVMVVMPPPHTSDS